jgi:hypothetical protein
VALPGVGSATGCQKSLFDSLPYKNPTSESWIFFGFIEREGGFCPLHTSPAALSSKVFHVFLHSKETAPHPGCCLLFLNT